MTRTHELLNQIEERGLLDEFAQAVAFDITDQAEFVAEEGKAMVALMKQAIAGVDAKEMASNTPLLVAEFFLGVESIDNYMEDFLNGLALPNRG